MGDLTMMDAEEEEIVATEAEKQKAIEALRKKLRGMKPGSEEHRAARKKLDTLIKNLTATKAKLLGCKAAYCEPLLIFCLTILVPLSVVIALYCFTDIFWPRTGQSGVIRVRECL